MSVILTAVLAGAGAGLASAPHCAAMCGPLAACATGPRKSLTYHASRLSAYALVGALAGWGSRFAQELVLGRAAGAVFSWSVALALGLLAYRLWRDPAERRLVKLGRRRKASLGDRLFAALPKHPAALGAMTALLPCGALYAALALAAGTGSPGAGALSMLAFGMISALGLAAVGVVIGPLRRAVAHPLARRGLATLCLVAAIVFVVRPIGAIAESPAESCHTPQ